MCQVLFCPCPMTMNHRKLLHLPISFRVRQYNGQLIPCETLFVLISIIYLFVNFVSLCIMIIKLSQFPKTLCYMRHGCCIGHWLLTFFKHIQLHYPKCCVWGSLGHFPLSYIIALLMIIIVGITFFVTGEYLAEQIKMYSYILWFHGRSDYADATQDVHCESCFTGTCKVILKPSKSWMCKSQL